MVIEEGQKKIKLKKHPSIACYRSVDDLILLKEWFYNFSEEQDYRFKAIQRVKALSSRGNIPHAIESTSLLSSIYLSDPAVSSNTVKQTDSNILKLSYSMAIIRFVNGLLDPFQQSNFAIPLHQLARNLKLPSFFVELRHMGTHEKLPNLDILRIGCNKALNWLYDNYWNDISNSSSDYNTEDTKEEISEVTLNKVREAVNSSTVVINNILSNLKSFKKIRKQNLDIIYKYGNSSEMGQKYWFSVKAIKNYLKNDASLIVKTLIFKNFLIYNIDKLQAREQNKKFKFNTLLIKLYEPLIDEFGPDFKLELLVTTMRYLEVFINGDDKSINYIIDEKLGFIFKHEDEINQILEWAAYLIDDLLSEEKYNFKKGQNKIKSRNDLLEYFLNKFTELPNEYRERILRAAMEAIRKKPHVFDQSLKDKLENELEIVRKEIKIDSFSAPPSLEDLLEKNYNKRVEDDLEIASNKRRKSSPIDRDISEKKTFIFEKHLDWKAVPFGNFV